MVFLVNIDSQDRLSGTADSFSLQLPQNYKTSFVNLLSCQIPATIYNVDINNNVFIWSDGSTHIIQIPPGAYDIGTLCTTLQDLMNLHTPVITVTYNAITQRVTITKDAGFFSIGTSVSSTLNYTIGFASIYDVGQDINYDFTSLTYTGYANIRLYDSFKFLIVIDVIGSGGYASGSNDALLEFFNLENRVFNGILYTFTVPILVDSNGITQFDINKFYPQRIELPDIRSIQFMNVSLFDDGGIPIRLNEGNWSMLLEIDNQINTVEKIERMVGNVTENQDDRFQMK